MGDRSWETDAVQVWLTNDPAVFEQVTALVDAWAQGDDGTWELATDLKRYVQNLDPLPELMAYEGPQHGRGAVGVGLIKEMLKASLATVDWQSLAIDLAIDHAEFSHDSISERNALALGRRKDLDGRDD